MRSNLGDPEVAGLCAETTVVLRRRTLYDHDSKATMPWGKGGAVTRRVVVLVVAAGAVFLGLVGISSLPASASPISLVLPQSTAFSYLGHSCGGIQEKAYATGFDATNGYPTGDVYLSTSCGGSGRGGGYHVTTYVAWAGVTWDFTGAVVTSAALSSAPSVNPTFSAFDANGNEIYNQSNSALLSLSPTFVPAPRVTSLSAVSGPVAGGTSLTITGTGFTAATAVDFGLVAAASYTVNSDTSITAVSPMTSAGTVHVIVSRAGGPSATSTADQFTFVAVPVVTGLSPSSGPLTPSTTVTISGTNLTGATQVSFGDTLCGFVVNDDTSITAYAPLGEAVDTVAVTVTTIGGTSVSTPADVFTYTATATNTPGAPTMGGATGGDTSATVSFSAPLSDGGSPITSYTVTAVDGTNPANGGQTAGSASSPITVPGLTNGDSYTFTVAATNSNGAGTASAPSNAVVPAGPATSSFSIATTSLSNAVRGAAYSYQLQATGGAAPYRWKLIGTLPRGLKLHPSGLLSGTPRLTSQSGPYIFTVQAKAKKSKGHPAQEATQVLTLSVS
jgi:hypothetical protein